jgi:hypothetical protein
MIKTSTLVQASQSNLNYMPACLGSKKLRLVSVVCDKKIVELFPSLVTLVKK